MNLPLNVHLAIAITTAASFVIVIAFCAGCRQLVCGHVREAGRLGALVGVLAIISLVAGLSLAPNAGQLLIG